MTTITIKEDLQLSRTTFENVEELIKALLHTSPLKIYQVDAEEFPTEVAKRIVLSKNNPKKKLSDFKG